MINNYFKSKIQQIFIEQLPHSRYYAKHCKGFKKIKSKSDSWSLRSKQSQGRVWEGTKESKIITKDVTMIRAT